MAVPSPGSPKEQHKVGDAGSDRRDGATGRPRDRTGPPRDGGMPRSAGGGVLDAEADLEADLDVGDLAVPDVAAAWVGAAWPSSAWPRISLTSNQSTSRVVAATRETAPRMASSTLVSDEPTTSMTR